MNKGIFVLIIIVLAALAFGLPYLLRRGEDQPRPEESPAVIEEGITPVKQVPQTSPVPSPLGTPAVSPSPRPSPSPSPTPSPRTLVSPSPSPTPKASPPATPTASPAAPVSLSASISNFAFASANLTVKKGTKVTWTNQDGVGHTVTGDSGGPASSLLTQGASYTFTFDTVGTFPYHCTPHPFMKGTVTVTE